MMIPIVAHAILATVVPHLAATATQTPPRLDGRLDEPAWQAAAATEAFTQKVPSEGTSPSERTTLRVLYDEEAIYVGFDCEQRSAPVVRHLTRRGRQVEGDWVAIDIGTRRDGKSAFEFMVSAAGVLVDGLRFNDTDYVDEWDENWDARAALTERGWSAELKIPLRILRFDSLPVQSWDFEARRYISARQETDEWALIPRDAGGEVSRYGILDGLVNLKRRTPLEMLPFVLLSLRQLGAAEGLVGSGVAFSGSVGFDLKWHPSQALTVDASVNPDFAQVEPDQLVLNLTQFETYFPEKRPFFLEGMDVYRTPMQILYPRRIGLVPALPVLRTTPAEQLVDLPRPTPILGAAKITGRIADHWTIGALEAVTDRNDVLVQALDGTRAPRLVDPTSAYSVLRIRRDFGKNAEVGLIATAANHFEPTGSHPPIPAAPATTGPLLQLCPDGSALPRSSRCWNDAYVAGLDWRWRSSGGTWVTGGQAALSVLGQGPSRLVGDGTVIDPGNVGTGVVAYVNKEGGEHWVGDAGFEFDDRKFDVNDLGFARRANNYRWWFEVEYRHLKPWWKLLEAHARFEYWDRYNLDGLNLGNGGDINISGKTNTMWRFYTALSYRGAWFDDREIGDGTALQHAGLFSHELDVTSDRTRRVSFTMYTDTEILFNGFSLYADAGVLVRVLPQFDVELLPTVRYTFGEPRYAGAGPQPGQLLFGKLDARAVGITMRATYTFTPRLTLQAYAQLFLASQHYSQFSMFQSDPKGPRPAVYLNDLQPYPGAPAINPDIEQGAFNVNVVLRWEFLLGSTLYAVYSRTQVPTVMLGPGETAALGFGTLGRSPATNAFVLKISYWFG